MAVKTLQAIINSMTQYIAGAYPKADTSEGSIISDIVVMAPAQEITKMYDQDQLTSDNQALATANDDGLDIHGANFTAARLPAITSKGVATLFSYSAPVNDITIPAGTLVSTVFAPGTTQIQFHTVRTTIMFAAVGTSYLNGATGLYEIPVDIECNAPGVIGVVGAQTITTIINPIAGIDGVYNSSPTQGGADAESSDAYRQRLALLWQGNAVGTDTGILSLVQAQTGVENAILVGHGLSPRNEFGAIDVYIKGVSPTQYIDSFLININDPQTSFIPTKQPLIATDIQTIIYGASGSMTPPSYSVSVDTSAYAGSVLAHDQVVWGTALPYQLGSVYVTYTYNGLIEELQNLFAPNSSNDISNANILVKWASVISIDVTVLIKVLPGFDSLNVTFDVQDALALFFDGLNIGAQVQQADVVRVILNTPGVDDARLPLDVFKSTDGSITPNVFGDLILPPSGYAVGGNIIVNVTT